MNDPNRTIVSDSMEPRTRFELVTLAFLWRNTKAMLLAGVASTRLSHRGICRAVCFGVLYDLLEDSAKLLGNHVDEILKDSGQMEDSSERVVGDLPVVAHLTMGYEKLTLFFTDRRIVVSRRGKVGAGSIPITFIFGSFGSALSGLFGGGTRKALKKKARYPLPSRILASDKDNFSIVFDEVVRADLTRTPSTCNILILSRDDKFDFTCRSRFDHIRSLLETALGSKLTVHHKD